MTHEKPGVIARRYRHAMKLTLEQMAERMGIVTNHLGQTERGMRNYWPLLKDRTIEEIKELFNIDDWAAKRLMQCCLADFVKCKKGTAGADCAGVIE